MEQAWEFPSFEEWSYDNNGLLDDFLTEKQQRDFEEIKHQF